MEDACGDSGDEAGNGEDATNDGAKLEKEMHQGAAATCDLDCDGGDLILEVDGRRLARRRVGIVEVVRELVGVLCPPVGAE